jgi:BirA family biotin operon repressor/biotin-[acetyl-CoA-carboxylase] ligase
MPFDIEYARQKLPGRNIFYHEMLDSTMRAAAALAPGEAVVADEQTAGQGRYGRSWYSEKDAGLYVSVVLRPAVPSGSLPVLTLALGLAAAEAIAKATGLRCDLRWPNDLMLEQKKVAGILVQVMDSRVIAGIGINVNHQAFPGELARQATSLRIESGRPNSREDLLIALLSTVDSFCKMLEDAGKEAILAAFTQNSSWARDRQVRVDQGDRVLEGVTDGLDPSGFLLLRKPDGTRSLIVAGGVRAAGS